MSKRTHDITVSQTEKETIEFIELLKNLTRDEQNQVKGYMACLKTVRNIKTA